MIKRFFILIIIILISVAAVYSSDRTEILLDKAIEEFSKENYDEALRIIDMVLIEEPDNDIAQMYKRTIEDVAQLDKVEDAQSEERTDESRNNNGGNDSDEGNSGDDGTAENREILSISTYIGSTLDREMILEEGLKIILGIPVIELKLRSNPIDYDVNTIFDKQPPFNELFSFDNYSFDFGIGARYYPFNSKTKNSGFFDFKLGATNFTIDVDKVVPYLGFDTEVRIFSMFGDNLIFNNFWIGGRGNLYFYDNNVTNNYTIEGKLGMRVAFFNIGVFYGMSQMESITYTTKYNQTYGGLILGFNF